MNKCAVTDILSVIKDIPYCIIMIQEEQAIGVRFGVLETEPEEQTFQ